MSRICASLLASACTALIAASAATPAFAVDVSDDFESYAVGSFPSTHWLDPAVTFGGAPGFPAPPQPSATVVQTTDAFGNETQALALADALGSPKGVYAITGETDHLRVQSDLRIDRFANGDPNVVWVGADPSVSVGFFKADPNSSAFAVLYVSSTTHGWRFEYSGPNTDDAPAYDLDLGVAAELGHWYSASISLDKADYRYDLSVRDTTSGDSLLTQSIGFDDRPEIFDDGFDAVMLWGLESSPTDPPQPGEATLANLAVFDNVTVAAVPEPAPSLMLAAGLALLGWRCRRAC